MIYITQRALLKTVNFQTHSLDFSKKALRLYLAGKGCDGFTYGVTFDEGEDHDLKFNYHRAVLVVDPETYGFVRGATIDWVDDERGSGFLVENPGHKKFRGKFFKKPGWENKFLSPHH